MNDQSIIESLKKGNHQIFSVLYRHYPLIEKLVLKNNGSKDDAKDVFQNTLILFYKNVLKNDFTLSSKISTYLFGIAQNIWLKKLRDNKIIKVPLEENHIIEEQHTNETTSPAALSLKDFLKKKLQELGEPCLSLIVMHSYEKLSMSTISDKMGYANEHTARQQKYKCLQRLRKMIPLELKSQYINE